MNKNEYPQKFVRENKGNYIEERPWGKFEILADQEKFKAKTLTVKPGAKLSLQSHQKRSEHWVVVSGTAKVVNGDEELILNYGESTFIPVGNKHRIENPGEEDLVILEVQTGEYFGEDDIERYEDIYDRIKK